MVGSNGRQKQKRCHNGGAMFQRGTTTGKDREPAPALTREGCDSNPPSCRMVTSGKMVKILQLRTIFGSHQLTRGSSKVISRVITTFSVVHLVRNDHHSCFSSLELHIKDITSSVL